MKKWKKALSLLLALSMTLSMVLTVSAETKPMPFSDISGHWAQDYIIEASEKELVDGYPDGTFQPNGTLTRAEMVQVLYNLAGSPASDAESTFTDGNGQWYTPAVVWAEQEGILNGYPDGSCGANDPVTRQEMVTILHRYADVEIYNELVTGFPDWSNVGTWAQAAFVWAITEGLVNGVLNENGVITLDPQATATRASFAKIMVSFVNGQEEEQPPVESEDPEPPAPPVESETPEESDPPEETRPLPPVVNETDIVLKDGDITVDGLEASTDPTDPVYTAHDIIFYLEGQGISYGEGTAADEHSQEEADWHTVVHITQPGTYRISGKLSAGQIAIDLGEDAETDPNAVVTLILDGVDITCTVAPAIIFYNVYECDTVWMENEDTTLASMDVDTSAAGANVIIPDGTENYVKGSYVARIYKPGSVEMNEDGTEVLDAKKLHKYDAAFYSKMSMNISGGEENTGSLYIEAENEGLDSELHLTLNGGMIYIAAGNDCINTNEDYVSVTTINGGALIAVSMGTTGEGDAVDSNGWLVVNGGVVIVQGYSNDGSLDADNGVYLNGGVILAAGAMQPERGFNGTNPKVLFNYSSRGDETLTIKTATGDEVVTQYFPNGFSYVLFSSPELAQGGTYTLWNGETQVATGTEGAASGGMGPGGMMPGGPGGMTPPEGGTPPTPPEGGMTPPEGGMPTPPEGGMTPPQGGMPTPPEGGMPTPPEGGTPPAPPTESITPEEAA